MTSNDDVLEFDFKEDVPMAGPSSDNLMQEIGHISINLAKDMTSLEEAHLAMDLGNNDLVDVKAFKGLVHRQNIEDSDFSNLNANMANLMEIVKAYFAMHDSLTFASQGL